MQLRLAHRFSIAFVFGTLLAASSEAAFISASGTVYVNGGACTPTTTALTYDETCLAPDGTEARAMAFVSPTGGLPEMGALASLTSLPGSVGGSATGIAEYEDRLVVDFAVASMSFTLAIDGIVTSSGIRGDGPAAYYEMMGNGRFIVFDEFGVGPTTVTVMTGDIPTPGGVLDYSLLFKALVGAPGGGNQFVDFSSTLAVIDVIQKDASGNRVFTPIVSELGFVYRQGESSVPEPSALVFLSLGLVGAIARRSRT